MNGRRRRREDDDERALRFLVALDWFWVGALLVGGASLVASNARGGWSLLEWADLVALAIVLGPLLWSGVALLRLGSRGAPRHAHEVTRVHEESDR